MNANILLSMFSFFKVLCILGLVVAELAADQILQFPREAVGVVWTGHWPTIDGPKLLFANDALQARRAQGIVAVDDDLFVTLELSQPASQDLSFLRQLPADGIHSLTIRNADLDAVKMECIAGLKSLRKLIFSECQLSKDTLDSVAVFPELVHLNMSLKDPKPEQMTAVAAWVARQKKLHTLYCRPELTATNWDTIGPHQTLQATIVRLDANAKGVLERLQRLPDLKSLSVLVDGSVDVDALAGIGSLQHIEELRWFYGRVNGSVLQQLASHQRLKHLLLFQFNPGDDFMQSLETLSELTHLDLVPAEGVDLKGVANHLARLPKLRSWPRLRNIDAEAFQKIVARKSIENLSVEFAGKDVTPDMLMRIGGMQSLQRLDLSGLPVDDDWLSCLSDLKELEFLRLFNTGVTGSGFSELKDLPKLREIDVWLGVSDREWRRPDLTALSTLASLKVVHIGGGGFEPNDIEPLRKCRQLRKIRLYGGGFTSDVTAAQLARLPNLVDLTFSNNGFVTDAGAHVLAQHANLQRLFVSGAVSATGARELSNIPTLRQLGIRSLLIDAAETEELSQNAVGLPHLSVGPYTGSVVLDDFDTLHKGVK